VIRERREKRKKEGRKSKKKRATLDKEPIKKRNSEVNTK
jgi:hypothetical protein